MVTTEWVLAEAVTVLKARGAVDHALALGEAIQAGRLGHLVESTSERRRRAWELFVRHRDRRVGWVDCASFAVMRRPGSPSSSDSTKTLSALDLPRIVDRCPEVTSQRERP